MGKPEGREDHDTSDPLADNIVGRMGGPRY